MRTPIVGVAALAPLILAGAVGASAPPHHGMSQAAVTPLAAVEPQVDRDGPAVVAAAKAPTRFHIATTTAVSAPPPAVVVNSPGALGIPGMALNAYRNAERMMAAAYPGCGVSWNLLAGIGRIESMHANGGATDARGTAVRPIYGPALDGTLPGNEIIVQSAQAGRVTYARAMGPMQFLPGTWARYASDGDGDGKAEVQNLFDASLAAARYLCSGGLNLRDQSQVMTAILRYNNSVAYAHNVLGWAAAYATGVVPVDLPPITGSIPALGDTHLERREGLGPGLPTSALGLPADDPGPLRRLIATLPALEMPRPDWPDEAIVVGPLHFEPTSAVLEIPAGDGPVVMVAPSTAVTGAQGMAEMALECLRPGETLPPGARVVVSRLAGPDTAVPPWATVGLGRQDELLTHADVVICGGGHGMVSKSLLAGVPMVVVPGGGDQWEIANRVVRQGSAQLVRPLTAGALTAAVGEVLGAPSYRRAAQTAGASVADVADPVQVCHDALTRAG
ncbi:lytic murein transglycosylase [Mycolicibacterium goodii]|uniref:lytic murein transglycosylase n=1 Tax=Mycolicibacterium goodii TaxID=134601 RepID=UPI0018ED16C9